MKIKWKKIDHRYPYYSRLRFPEYKTVLIKFATPGGMYEASSVVCGYFKKHSDGWLVITPGFAGRRYDKQQATHYAEVFDYFDLRVSSRDGFYNVWMDQPGLLKETGTKLTRQKGLS